MWFGVTVRAKVIATTFSVLAALWGVLFAWTSVDRQAAVQSDSEILSQIVAGVAERSNGLFKLAEIALNAGQQQIAMGQGEDLHNRLLPLAQDIRATSGGLLDLFLADSDGDLALISPNNFPSSTAAVDAHLSRARMNGQKSELVFGKPIFGQILGEWVLPMTIGARQATGDPFLIAALRLERLAKSQDQQRVGGAGAIGMVGFDGVTLSRAPFSAAHLGKDISRDPNFVRRSRSPETARAGISSIPLEGIGDTTNRLFYSFRSDRYRIYFYASISLDHVLEPAHRRFTLAAVGLGIISALGCAAAYLVARGFEDTAEAHRRFVDFAETASNLVWEFDPEGRFTFLSYHTHEIFGVASDEILGRKMEALGWFPVDEECRGRFADALTGRSAFSDIRFRRVGQGTPVEIVSMSGRPIWSRERFLGYRGAMTDITARVKLDEARRSLAERKAYAGKMEAIGQLADGIAHDFNNLLGAIMGFGQFLAQDLPAGSPQQRFAERIVLAGRRGQNLVQQIVAYSRRSPGGEVEFTVADIIAETTELLRGIVPPATRLEVVDDGGALTIRGDRGQMCQVLLNLCANANDALEQGGEIRIEVTGLDEERLAERWKTVSVADGDFSASWTDEDGFNRLRVGNRPKVPCVSISVSDNGVGIAHEHMDRLFELFFSTKCGRGGSGMGLVVVQRVVTESGGAVLVRTKPGAGTCFEVIIPQADAPAPTCAVASAASVNRNAGGASVLVVDDDDDFRDMAVIALERVGYRVVAMSRPRAALEAVTVEPTRWEAMVTDQTMPDMRGVELVKGVKAVNPSIRCVICTGYSSGLGEAEALAAGADGFRTKPLDVDDLTELLGALLQPTGADAVGGGPA